ncbi:MAG: type II toxin-antitoxin system Phd/YefM family antitoxin [Acidobacteriaceae bacterium]
MSAVGTPSKKMLPHSAKVIALPAGEFKAKCLALMDEVQATGATIVITRRGKPVARLAAPSEPQPTPFRSLRGLTKGSMTYSDDLIKPIEGFDWTWDAENV